MSLVFNNYDYAGDLIEFVEAAKTSAAARVVVKTFSTPGLTIANPTATTVVTTPSALTSYGYTQAQADALVASNNALVADVAVLRGLVVTLVEALEATGILG